MTTDKARHSEKVGAFTAAVSGRGFDKVAASIGVGAADAMAMAQDASDRGQSDSIVACFLYSAQQRFDRVLGGLAGEVDLFAELRKLARA